MFREDDLKMFGNRERQASDAIELTFRPVDNFGFYCVSYWCCRSSIARRALALGTIRSPDAC